MIDDDCEDQALTKLSDGCFQCPYFVPGESRSRNTQLIARNGWWVCPKCGGSYGATLQDGEPS